MTKIAVPTRRAKNTRRVRPPIRPMDFMSPTELTAVTSNETTNGITVILIAFTQRVPIGVTKSTA